MRYPFEYFSRWYLLNHNVGHSNAASTQASFLFLSVSSVALEYEGLKVNCTAADDRDKSPPQQVSTCNVAVFNTPDKTRLQYLVTEFDDNHDRLVLIFHICHSGVLEIVT